MSIFVVINRTSCKYLRIIVMRINVCYNGVCQKVNQMRKKKTKKKERGNISKYKYPISND